jgi:carbon monoxide dehydrogenase subunit G
VSGSFEGRKVATVRQRIAVPPEDVWAVLADGWLFAVWVVGACRVRDVSPAWPAAGETIHHSFGSWPLLINDRSVVLESTPVRELVLRAKGWPLGEATVRIELTPDGADATVVTMREDATAGPGLLVPASLRRLGLRPRDVESLRRLGLIAEGRHREWRRNRTGTVSSG